MKCRFQSKIFQNEANGYTIAAYWTADPSIPNEVRKKPAGNGFIITAVGNDLPMIKNLTYELTGYWVNNPKYGTQFEVEAHMEIVKRTKEGIIGYLSSGAIRGIGEKTAQAIFDRFGLDTLEIMEQHPEELLAIRGINEKKLDEIKSAYNENQCFRELMTFLAPYKITSSQVKKILLEFGSMAPEIIRQRPYKLCEIKGFGFLTVDKIAKKFNANLNDPIRIAGGISYLMKKAASEGDLYLYQKSLISKALELLNAELPQQAVNERQIQRVLYQLALQRDLIVEGNRIYEYGFYEMERETAKMLVAHLLDKVPLYNVEKELEEAQQVLNIRLSEAQAKAVRMTFAHPVSIITGGPGTGKTTVLKVILYIQKQLRDDQVQLMAPTGRAARRMAESTGEENASTMHSALGLAGDDEFNEDFEYLDANFLCIDEFSMVDMRLAYEFFRHIKRNVRILCIGDADQLPSVGLGEVFRQLIECGLIPVTVLDLVYRQAEHIRIYENAQRIKDNTGALHTGDDFQILECSGAEETAALVQKVFRQELQGKSIDDVQVLTPYRKRGAASVNELNQVLREIVNPQDSRKRTMTVGKRKFREGDKVIQTKNRDLVSNGDMGIIRQFFLDEEGRKKAKLLFSDEREMIYSAEDMDEVELAYATTVHKSQGSEYPVVILPWIKGFYTMLKRPILYTAVTRAKEKLIIVGEQAALYQAIRTDNRGMRNTILAKRIVAEYHTATENVQETDCEQLKLAI